MPLRFRRALYHVVEDAMPDTFGVGLGEWLAANMRLLDRGGDELGEQRFNFEITEIEKYCGLIAPFHAMVVERFPEALEACGVEPFDLRMIETHATLYHHGSHFVWHDDAPGFDGSLVATRRMTFCLYMHTDPKMFQGGELEFLDGTRVEPENNRFVFFHPIQQHKVRRVECYSADPMHGRWALMGWVHGDPPPGYVEAVPKMRGLPG